MIKSCAECTTKCCKAGSGPYEPIPAQQWLSGDVQGSSRYNKKCENFDEETELCKIWSHAPLICKTFVCSNRVYSRAELRRIDKLRSKK